MGDGLIAGYRLREGYRPDCVVFWPNSLWSSLALNSEVISRHQNGTELSRVFQREMEIFPRDCPGCELCGLFLKAILRVRFWRMPRAISVLWRDDYSPSET